MFQFKIKNLREINRLSQADFARRLDVSQSTVGMWESGRNKPTYDMLLRLRDEFKVNVGYFFDELPLELRSEAAPLRTNRPVSLYMPDDSMAPELQKDDQLILHPVKDFADGALTAFQYKGVTYVRRIQKMPEGWLALAAGQTPALMLPRESGADLQILGLVIELRRSFG